MERSGDSSAFEGLSWAELGTASHESWHLNFGELELETTEVGLRHVLDLVLTATRRLLNDQRHFFGSKIGAERGVERSV